VQIPEVASAVLEIDELVARLFSCYFGDPELPETQAQYLEALHRFAINTLPPAPERLALIPEGDFRKRTAGHHTLDNDLMWFAWALHIEAAELLTAYDTSRRALMMAGIATGCSANFAWGGHRRTRREYGPDEATARRLQLIGGEWAEDFEAARREVHSLYRLREWGHD
jgi:hypothetical protein